MRKPPAKTVSVEVPALAGTEYPPCRGQAGLAAGRGGRAEAHGAKRANRAPQVPLRRSLLDPVGRRRIGERGSALVQATAIRSAAAATGRVAPMTNPK